MTYSIVSCVKHHHTELKCDSKWNSSHIDITVLCNKSCNYNYPWELTMIVQFNEPQGTPQPISTISAANMGLSLSYISTNFRVLQFIRSVNIEPWVPPIYNDLLVNHPSDKRIHKMQKFNTAQYSSLINYFKFTF